MTQWPVQIVQVLFDIINYLGIDITHHESMQVRHWRPLIMLPICIYSCWLCIWFKSSAQVNIWYNQLPRHRQRRTLIMPQVCLKCDTHLLRHKFSISNGIISSLGIESARSVSNLILISSGIDIKHHESMQVRHWRPLIMLTLNLCLSK